MSNPVSRGRPSSLPPRPTTIFRSARSLMSTTRFPLQVEDVDPESFESDRLELLVGHAGLVVPAGVDARSDEVVRGSDGVDVPGEVEVELVHRDHLAVSAAGRPALDSEGRSHRRLANAGDCLLADLAQTLGESDRRGRLAFPQRSRRDRRDVDVLAARLATDPLQRIEVHLCFGAAIRDEVVGGESDPLGDLVDRLEICLAGDVDVTRN
jgi:hypothetical protein